MNSSINNKEYIGSYLAGLFEACCSIYIPKEGSKNNPKFIFTLHEYNYALGQIIQNRLKVGNLYNKNNKITYEIPNKEGVKKLIEIIHPYMRTPKIHKLNKLIEYMNKYKDCNIPLAEIDNSELDNNAWLSGWLETNGSFFLRVDDTITKLFQCCCHFMLSHKKVDKDNNSYGPFMEKFAIFFGANLLEHTSKLFSRKDSIDFPKKHRDTLYCVSITDSNYLLPLITYLNKYPLFGIQHLRYIKFYIVYLILYKLKIEKEITDRMILKIIELIKKEMINIDYNSAKVEHLDKFPELPSEESEESKK